MASYPSGRYIRRGVLVGLAVLFCAWNITNPALHEMRSNRLIFTSIIFGSCTAFLFCALNSMFTFYSPLGTPVQTTGYFFRACGDLCLFIILTERALALYRTTQTRKLIIKCLLPIALSIPSFGLVLIRIINTNLYDPSVFYAARNCSITLSVFTISSNIGLSALFLRTLLQNRSGALKITVMENKMQWSVIGLDILVAIIVGILRIITFLPITQGGVLNSIAVHGYAGMLKNSMFLRFYDLIILTIISVVSGHTVHV